MAATYDLSGRTAIVTGGAKGIGRAIARTLSANGANLAIWDLDADLAIETAHELGADSSKGFGCDVSDHDSVSSAFDETIKHFKKIDILVNNAGITGPNATLVEYSPSEVD